MLIKILGRINLLSIAQRFDYLDSLSVTQNLNFSYNTEISLELYRICLISGLLDLLGLLVFDLPNLLGLLAYMKFTPQRFPFFLEFTPLGLPQLPKVHSFKNFPFAQSSLFQDFHTCLKFTPLRLSHLSKVHSFRTFSLPRVHFSMTFIFYCLTFNTYQDFQTTIKIQSLLNNLDFTLDCLTSNLLQPTKTFLLPSIWSNLIKCRLFNYPNTQFPSNIN